MTQQPKRHSQKTSHTRKNHMFIQHWHAQFSSGWTWCTLMNIDEHRWAALFLCEAQRKSHHVHVELQQVRVYPPAKFVSWFHLLVLCLAKHLNDWKSLFNINHGQWKYFQRRCGRPPVWSRVLQKLVLGLTWFGMVEHCDTLQSSSIIYYFTNLVYMNHLNIDDLSALV